MEIACHRIQCKEQKEKKQKHFWCVWIKFILVMTSCSAVHIKTKRLLCSWWEFYLCAVTLPVLNHDVLLTLPKTMVCLKVFKKYSYYCFLTWFHMLNMGSLKTQPESCWHCCFHTSEMCCNLFWKEDLSPIREIQRCLRHIIRENKISILVVSWGVKSALGLLGRIFKAVVCSLFSL